mmetsp:Transcript_3731/g.8887  ORF Transcript_3731/g.8887 Transcript_3731/m.8887 type:complete len:235 (-) Transcript_3731:492-1196(-)
MDRVGTEVAAPNQTVLKEGVAVHLTHHVQVEGIPAHNVLLAHADSCGTSQMTMRSGETHHVAAISGRLARFITLESDGPGEQGHLCGILGSAVMAELQSLGQRDLRAADAGDLSYFVLVVVRFIRPGRGDDRHLLTHLPIYLVLQGQICGSRHRSACQPRPCWPVAQAVDLQESPVADNEALGVQWVRGPRAPIAGAGKGHCDATGNQRAAGGTHAKSSLDVDRPGLERKTCDI